MNPDEFEKQLQRQPIRPVPAQWRREILAAAKAQLETAARPGLRARLSAIFWPCPEAWAGLAAVWAMIFFLNAGMGERSRTMEADNRPRTIQAEVQTMVFLRAQELARLNEQPDVPLIEPPKTPGPRPRSERHIEISLA